MSIAIRNAVTWRDALGMRLVRNECRSFMTRDRRKISLWRQIMWWRKLPFEVKPFVMEDNVIGIVGYGLVIVEPPLGLLSGGLLPSHRGRDFGTQLFRHLALKAEECGVIPWLEVRGDNQVAQRLYQKLDFVEVSRANGVICMQRTQSQ